MILVNKSPAKEHLYFWITVYGWVFTIMIAAVSLLAVLFIIKFKDRVNRILSFFVIAMIITFFFDHLFAISSVEALDGESLDHFM